MHNTNHKFPIEQGRYKNIPREQRICNLCCNNLVVDEFHYLFVCNEFSLRQRRRTFINDILKTREHEGTERDTEGVGQDVSIPLK